MFRISEDENQTVLARVVVLYKSTTSSYLAGPHSMAAVSSKKKEKRGKKGPKLVFRHCFWHTRRVAGEKTDVVVVAQ